MLFPNNTLTLAWALRNRFGVVPDEGADEGGVAGLRGLFLRKVKGESKVGIPEGKETITSGKARFTSVPGRGGVHSLVVQGRQRPLN